LVLGPYSVTSVHARLGEPRTGSTCDWKSIGPYLSERAWGTVREDYSANGDAWGSFPFDHARSRAYRWSEDGLAGICDRAQRLCFALSFWNGRDPILKERIFGLAGPEGNHGEDGKDYWWYLDATPTASWLSWRYHYPQSEFPYARLRQENAQRSRNEREFELIDTGAFDDDRYWQIAADYAKAAPDDICIRIIARNAGADPADLHVLPTLWFRNRWSWEGGIPKPIIDAAPEGTEAAAVAIAEEEMLGKWRFSAGPSPDGRRPPLLFCENETNVQRLYGDAGAQTKYPKDGIGDHVVHGAETVNPEGHGTKMACWYRVNVPAGEAVEFRLRLARETPGSGTDLGKGFEQTMADRRREADEFYATFRPEGVSDDEAVVMRQAFAGMHWSQQFYHYDVARWLDGDAIPPPIERKSGRNAGWLHLSNHDMIAMPDKWEYPWYASWDLAFHCVVLAYTDPETAKHQLLLLEREWFMHPSGKMPAYEWNFGDVNPPVHAWATLKVFEIDGGGDFEFLARAFHKLTINFTWWVNRKDALGDNIFEGGFVGLDNIGLFDRSAPLSGGETLEQSDGTAWMAKFCLNMLEIALRLANHDLVYEDVAVKFFEHFALIAVAMGELWDEQDGFFYDRIRRRHGTASTVRARSMVGLMPVFAAVEVRASLWERLPMFRDRARWYIDHKPEVRAFLHNLDGKRPGLISLVDERRLRRVLTRMLDEAEFLSPFGLRSLSRDHREHPLDLDLDGRISQLDYEPGESRTGLFGGNSNWRGPIWFPLNFLAIESLRHLHDCFGGTFTVELPTGSGALANLEQVAEELERRPLRLFLLDANGRRPVGGTNPRFQHDPAWRDSILFYEYFNGDTGEGLGASHQTGWTALTAALSASRRSRPHCEAMKPNARKANLT
jgi:hypothetical protein